MMLAATAASTLIALPIAVSLLTFTAEVLAGLHPDRPRGSAGPFPRTVVLMPAHDEAAGIGAAVAALAGARAAGIDVVVVADNCSDDTATIARAAGCRVVERVDPDRRGKGFALAAGRDALMADPPDCVIILDADCVVAGDGMVRLARASAIADAPVQSTYLFRPTPLASSGTLISNFAFLMKNKVRQQGMARLGGVAALTGTGMAIPWADFRHAPLASDDLVEDLSLGIWLTRRGRPPRFAADVTTWSDAATGADLLVQRRRWEHGFVSTARRQALPLVADGIRRGSRAMTWLGLHLLVPPLALLAVLALAALLGSAILCLTGASWWVPLSLSCLLAVATLAVACAWVRHGRKQLSARALLGIPRYIAAKLPIYRSFGGNGPAQWQRTRRENERS